MAIVLLFRAHVGILSYYLCSAHVRPSSYLCRAHVGLLSDYLCSSHIGILFYYPCNFHVGLLSYYVGPIWDYCLATYCHNKWKFLHHFHLLLLLLPHLFKTKENRKLFYCQFFHSLSLFLFLIFSFLISASRKQTSSMSCPETSNLKFAKINNLMKMHFSQSNPLRIDYLLTDGEIFTDRYLPTYLSFKWEIKKLTANTCCNIPTKSGAPS